MTLFAIWIILVVAAGRLDHIVATRRHVRLAKEVFVDELRQLRAESISTPGGFTPGC